MTSLLRRHWAIALVLGVSAPLYLFFTHSGEIISSFSDSPIYLLTARHFADPSAPMYGDIAAQSQFPPLYPLLLALTGGGASVPQAHAATTLMLLLAFLALYGWLRKLDVAADAAAAAVLIAALLPGLYAFALLVMSENLYLLLTVLALALLTPPTPSLRSLAGAAALVCAAALTRSVGVLLFLPLALTALRSPRRPQACAVVAVAFIPVVLWSALHKPPVSYVDALKVIYGVDPIGTLIRHISDQAPGIIAGIAEDLGGPGRSHGFADVVCVLLLACAAVRAIRLQPAGVYVAAYLCVMLIWPYPTELARLALVILPLMLVQSIAIAMTLPAQGRRWLASGGVAASLLFLVPILLADAARFREAADSGLEHARNNPFWYDTDNDRALWRVKVNDATAAALTRIGDFVPADDCVYILRPALVTFYSGRRGVVPPLEETDDDRFTRRLQQMGCNYILLRDSDSPSGTLRMFPSSRIRVDLEGVDAGTLEWPGRADPVVISILAKLPK